MRQDEMRVLIDKHVSAEDAGDLDAAVSVYTDDIEHDVVGAPTGPVYGPAAARHRYEQLLQEVRTDALTEVRRFYGDEFCVVEHDVTATVIGGFAGYPGNGRQVNFRMLHVFEFRDGLISRENVWMDTASVMAQLAAPDAATVGAI